MFLKHDLKQFVSHQNRYEILVNTKLYISNKALPHMETTHSCWLEVGMHLEIPTTSQVDYVFVDFLGP